MPTEPFDMAKMANNLLAGIGAGCARARDSQYEKCFFCKKPILDEEDAHPMHFKDAPEWRHEHCYEDMEEARHETEEAMRETRILKGEIEPYE